MLTNDSSKKNAPSIYDMSSTEDTSNIPRIDNKLNIINSSVFRCSRINGILINNNISMIIDTLGSRDVLKIF